MMVVVVEVGRRERIDASEKSRKNEGKGETLKRMNEMNELNTMNENTHDGLITINYLSIIVLYSLLNRCCYIDGADKAGLLSLAPVSIPSFSSSSFSSAFWPSSCSRLGGCVDRP